MDEHLKDLGGTELRTEDGEHFYPIDGGEGKP